MCSVQGDVTKGIPHAESQVSVFLNGGIIFQFAELWGPVMELALGIVQLGPMQSIKRAQVKPHAGSRFSPMQRL